MGQRLIHYQTEQLKKLLNFSPKTCSKLYHRGKCFIADFTKRIWDLLEVTHYKTTSYHPQTNGLSERLNHILADMLSMYVNSDHKNWDSILPYITYIT